MTILVIMPRNPVYTPTFYVILDFLVHVFSMPGSWGDILTLKSLASRRILNPIYEAPRDGKVPPGLNDGDTMPQAMRSRKLRAYKRPNYLQPSSSYLLITRYNSQDSR